MLIGHWPRDPRPDRSTTSSPKSSIASPPASSSANPCRASTWRRRRQSRWARRRCGRYPAQQRRCRPSSHRRQRRSAGLHFSYLSLEIFDGQVSFVNGFCALSSGGSERNTRDASRRARPALNIVSAALLPISSLDHPSILSFEYQSHIGPDQHPSSVDVLDPGNARLELALALAPSARLLPFPLPSSSAASPSLRP